MQVALQGRRRTKRTATESEQSPQKRATQSWPQPAANEVEIGVSKDKVVVSETETDFVFNDAVMKKAELARTCNCGPDDRCWAIAFSVLGWPNCLRLCQHPGAAGHESHDSSAQ